MYLGSFDKTNFKDSNPDPAEARFLPTAEGPETKASCLELKARPPGPASSLELTSQRNNRPSSRLTSPSRLTCPGPGPGRITKIYYCNLCNNLCTPQNPKCLVLDSDNYPWCAGAKFNPTRSRSDVIEAAVFEPTSIPVYKNEFNGNPLDKSYYCSGCMNICTPERPVCLVMGYNGEIRCINYAGSRPLSRTEAMSPTPIEANSPSKIVRLFRPVFATRSPPGNSERPPCCQQKNVLSVTDPRSQN